ncbi:MAG TPA: FlgO family outer membrane protein [Nitrospira sp.]|nr:FlgO family outer membrane protein [Nitrospira sp.]
MRTIGFLLLLITLVLPFPFPPSSWAAASYEDSLKQLAEGLTEGAAKAKKQRLAILDFTDSQGEQTPVGRFLAEELGTQIMVAGELTTVDRTLLYSTLKKMQLEYIDPAHAKAVRRAAKAIRADIFVSGTYTETPEGLQVTVRLITPKQTQSISATRTTFPKTGPLSTFFKKEDPPPGTLPPDQPKEPPPPLGLGAYRNDTYEFLVMSIERLNNRVKLDAMITNHSLRDLKLLCHLQNTVLKDEHGGLWLQTVKENREGLCTRGIELSPHRKQRVVFIFTQPSEGAASEFTLSFHEQLPRHDTSFTIDGLKLKPPPSPDEVAP